MPGMHLNMLAVPRLLCWGGQEYAVGSWQEGRYPFGAQRCTSTESLASPGLRRSNLLGYADKSFALREELRPQVLTWNGISWDFTLAAGEATGRAV